MNPWLIALIAAAAYYTYQNYLPKLRLPSGQDSSVTPLDEEKVRKMMDARDKQQVLYFLVKQYLVSLLCSMYTLGQKPTFYPEIPLLLIVLTCKIVKNEISEM